MPEDQDDLKKIHTYQSDVEEALKRSNISATQVFAAEQKKVNEEKEIREIKSRPTGRSFNYRALIIALLFLMLGGGVIYYFAFEKKDTSTPLPVIKATSESSIISYDLLTPLIFTQNKSDLTALIETNKQNDTTNGIELLSFNTTLDQFIYTIDPNVSGVFLRSLEPNFAFGIIKTQENSLPRAFLVAKINSYTGSRGSLLNEESGLISQFADIFDLPAAPLHFKDEVVSGLDARALVDDQGIVHFLYSFIDQKTLVFAPDNDTFNFIIQRIPASN